MEDNQKKPCVMIACGGTGGHLFPGIAVAQALGAQGVDSLLVISEKPVDKTASDSYPGLMFLALPAKPMPRPWSPKIFPFFASGWKAYKMCKEAMTQHGVQAVLGMGGFTSFVPIMAANQKALPIFLHDSNAIPGKANKLAARFARKVFLGIGEAAGHFDKAPTQVVGTPVRDEMRHLPSKHMARQRFGLHPDRTTLLVLGGSQGARALNRFTIDALDALDAESLQVLMLTGAKDFESTQQMIASKGLKHLVKVMAFCDDMPSAYACADLALARSGASTLSELAMAGLPVVLVPYPYAAEDHQTANALSYVSRGAAVMMKESDMDGGRLAALLKESTEDSEKLRVMSENMRGCACPGAAEAMAETILATIK